MVVHEDETHLTAIIIIVELTSRVTIKRHTHTQTVEPRVTLAIHLNIPMIVGVVHFFIFFYFRVINGHWPVAEMIATIPLPLSLQLIDQYISNELNLSMNLNILVLIVDHQH